ncbi:MAG: Ig-like domain-containing protein, partial [Mycobacterium sp.]
MQAGGIGRIAGIAVALGVGAAAATGGGGVAAAAPADDATVSSDSSPDRPAAAAPAAGAARSPSRAEATRRVDRKTQRQRRNDAPVPAAAKPASAVRAAPRPVKADPMRPARAVRPAAVAQRPARPASAPSASDPAALAAPPVTAPPAAPAALVAAPAAGTVRAVPAPFSSTGPGSPAEATAGWVVLAAVRRLGRWQPAAPAAAAVSTGQTLRAAARRNPFSLFSNRTPTLSPAQTGQSATGVVSGSLNAADADGDPLTFTVNANPAHGTVAVDSAGLFRYTPDRASAHAGVTDSFTVTVSDATVRTHYHGFAGLFGRRGNTGHTVTRTVTVTVSPVNAAPTGSGTAGVPNAATGIVTGKVSGADADGDSLSYNGSGPTPKGAVVVAAGGGFTYTPTAAARHAAANLTAATADGTDPVTVTITDGHGGSIAVPVLVAIAPANAAPTGAARAGSPDPATGVVRGSLGAADSDRDTLSYSAPAATAKGAIAVAADGSFTYTPNAAARHAAASPRATPADRNDAFT